MGDQKKPWEDVPIEVLIEEERKRREEMERRRERLYIPLEAPRLPPKQNEETDEVEDEESAIVIKFI